MTSQRPELQIKTMYYHNFFDVMKYIKEVYGVNHRSRTSKSFWDWLQEDSMNDVNNGCYITICTNPNRFHEYYHISDISDIKEFEDEYEEVFEVINILWNEYELDEMTFWVSW